MAPVRGRGNWPFRKHERNVVIVMIRYEWYDFLNPYSLTSRSMLSQHLSSPNSLWDPPAPCTSGANKWDPLSIAPKAPRTTAQPPLPAPRNEKRRFPWQTTPRAKQETALKIRNLWKFFLSHLTLRICSNSKDGDTLLQSRQSRCPSSAPHLHDGMGDFPFITWCWHDDLVDQTPSYNPSSPCAPVGTSSGSRSRKRGTRVAGSSRSSDSAARRFRGAVLASSLGSSKGAMQLKFQCFNDVIYWTFKSFHPFYMNPAIS